MLDTQRDICGQYSGSFRCGSAVIWLIEVDWKRLLLQLPVLLLLMMMTKITYGNAQLAWVSVALHTDDDESVRLTTHYTASTCHVTMVSVVGPPVSINVTRCCTKQWHPLLQTSSELRWRIRGKIIRTVQCCTVYHSNVHGSKHTQMSSSYRCNSYQELLVI